MDNKIKKDNLTDLISDLTKPVVAIPNKPSEKNPITETPKDLTDYQVVTPDGETITLNMTTIQKDTNIKKILASKDGKYILIIKESH
jgi:hypothetical protein